MHTAFKTGMENMQAAYIFTFFDNIGFHSKEMTWLWDYNGRWGLTAVPLRPESKYFYYQWSGSGQDLKAAAACIWEGKWTSVSKFGTPQSDRRYQLSLWPPRVWKEISRETHIGIKEMVCCPLFIPVILGSSRCGMDRQRKRHSETAASHFPFLWTFIMKPTPWCLNESNNLPLPFSFQAVEIMSLTPNQFEMKNKNKRRVSFNLLCADFERCSHAFKWGHRVDTWQQEHWRSTVTHRLTVWASSHQLWTMSAQPHMYRDAICSCIALLSSATPTDWSRPATVHSPSVLWVSWRCQMTDRPLAQRCGQLLTLKLTPGEILHLCVRGPTTQPPSYLKEISFLLTLCTCQTNGSCLQKLKFSTHLFR